MASTTVADSSRPSNPNMEVSECSILYNPAETDSDKVSTKLKDIVTENGIANTTKVSKMSSSEEKTKAKRTCRKGGIVFVVTEEILTGAQREFLEEMVECAIDGSRKIITVTYKVSQEQVPSKLRPYKTLDYEVSDFKAVFTVAVKEWTSVSEDFPMEEEPSYNAEGIPYNVGLIISVEVHPIKSQGARQNKNRVQEIKTIREALVKVLKDPTAHLLVLLFRDYTLAIRDVSLNPCKVIGKVRDEDMWTKVQTACEDRSLGSLFMQHVLAHLQKDMSYEIRLIAQRDTEYIPASNLSPVNSIIANVIFDIIKKKEFTVYDFYKQLEKLQGKADLRTIHSDPEGFNPLHAVIVYNRLPLILPLVHLKLFIGYLNESVPATSSSSFRGHTPRQIAESKKARRFKDALNDHERLVNSMGKFLKACHEGELPLVRRMVNHQRLVINEKDSFKSNCLYWAIVSNNLDLFMHLLDNGADANNVNENKETLLHIACMLGRSKYIETLMTRCKMDVTLTCSNKRTPLERVAENGDVDCLKELLKHSVFLTSCVLPYAAANGRLPFIKYVLEEVRQSLHVDMRDNTGRSAFMKACETGRKDAVEYLIIKGASVNVEDLRKRTPLHVACENGHEDIVKILLNKNAEINAQDCYTGAELCFLIRGKDKGRKAWHYVEVRRNVVHTFLQKTRAGQVDVALYGTVVKSGWGEDPEKPIVEWVEKMFADRRNAPNAPPDITPLHMAIYKQHTGVAKLLVERGANVNTKDQFGLTPFMLCALRCEKDIAVLLEEKGAKTGDKDIEGKTALEIAEMNDQTEMVNYIKGKGYFLQTQQFLQGPIENIKLNFEKEYLEKLRSEGKDVRRHIIDALRDLNIDINILLMDLGSGPIMKASSGAEQSTPTSQPVRASDSGLPPSTSTGIQPSPVMASTDGHMNTTQEPMDTEERTTAPHNAAASQQPGF